MSAAPRVTIAAASDVGLRRQHNEDSHAIWSPADEAERVGRGVLFVVADGMGGAQAGEVASRLAVQTVLRAYREAAGLDLVADLFAAVEAANHLIHEESRSSAERGGMGTTVTAAVIRGRDLMWAHVGDSRLYLLSGGTLRRLTRDHSLVAQMVRDGHITEEQARTDPRRNIVTRSVGVGPRVEVDAERLEGLLGPTDTVLLCSDGLHGVVRDEELAALAAGPDLAEDCAEAVALANRRGGPDNITIVLARLGA